MKGFDIEAAEDDFKVNREINFSSSLTLIKNNNIKFNSYLNDKVIEVK